MRKPELRSWTQVAVVLLVAGLMAGLGVLGVVETRALRSVAAADNAALVDRGATREVVTQVTDGLTRILTFDHHDPGSTRAAADEVLAGKARTEYDELFAALIDQTASQQLTLTTRVAVVGVEQLGSRSARLLVFLDQSSTRGSDGQSNVAAAQLAVTAERTGGTWRITGLEPL